VRDEEEAKRKEELRNQAQRELEEWWQFKFGSLHLKLRNVAECS
jgi:hypothetical protein